MGAFDNLNNVKVMDSNSRLEFEKILNTDLRKVDKHGNKVYFYTNGDNLQWEFIDSFFDVNDKGWVTLKANSKTITIKTNLENKQKNIAKAVRKLYNV